MIRFEYHGKTAYVAEYCCKLLKQEPAKKTEPAQREAVIEVKKSESDRASNTIQEPPQQQATTANEEAVGDATDVPERVVVPKENNKSAEKVTLSSVVFSSLSSFYDVHTLLELLKSKENNKFPLYFAHLIVPLTRCVQVTHVRK